MVEVGEDRYGVDENEFKQRWTSLTGTMMVKLMVMTFLSLIRMDETEIYDLCCCCGCTVFDRFGVMTSTRWTIT
jgi:DNA-binding transcriptional regulator of glucitol operon